MKLLVVLRQKMKPEKDKNKTEKEVQQTEKIQVCVPAQVLQKKKKNLKKKIVH